MALRPMNKIVPDNRYTFLVIDVEEKMVQHPDDAKADKSFRDSRQVQKQIDGVPVWSVQVKATHPNGDRGLMSVSVPSDNEPHFDGDVEFDNLTVGVWGTNGRSGMYFTADGVHSKGEAPKNPTAGQVK